LNQATQPLRRPWPTVAVVGRSLTGCDAWVVGITALAAFSMAVRLAASGDQSAYMDEGTNVLTGRMLIEQHAVYAEILNWAYGSYLWPLLAGMADELGGLRLVRGVSAVCGVVMVLATALAAARLAPPTLTRSRRWAVALLASGIMAVAPTAVAVGRFGTYDALAGAAFMFGVSLVMPASRPASPVRLVAAAALLFVAFLAKYIVALYFPFVCVYLVVAPLVHSRARSTRPPRQKNERAVSTAEPAPSRRGAAQMLRGMADGGVPRALGGGSLVAWLWSEERVRSAGRNVAWFVLPLSAACAVYALVFLGPLLMLLGASLHYGDLKSSDPLREYVWTRPELWVLVAAAALGWRQAAWGARLVALGGTAIIAAFQFEARPDFDFWKHSIYVLYFLAPLAALTWLKIPQNTGTWRVLGLAASGLALIWAWSPAVQQADRLIDFYPNLEPSLDSVEANIAGSALVLTDDTALRYYLYPGMGTDRVVGPFFFSYHAQDGIEAYRQAIADRFFDAIVLDGGVSPQGNAIRDQLGQTIQAAYERVYSEPDSGGFTVEVFKPIRPPGTTGAESNELNWPVALTFDADQPGLYDWGAHPDTGNWQAGLQIARTDEQTWNGHSSLRFTPTQDTSTLTLRRSGPVSRVRARVYVVPGDGSPNAVRIGLMGFDSTWQWHDDGFRWLIPPGAWTTITWDLTSPGSYEEVGLKLPPGLSQIYLGSFEIDP
jgi:hypothetical protein